MSSRPIEGMMETTLEKIKQMVDVNTVTGTPITTPDGTTIIPVSKIKYGFASGGSDIPSKHEKEHEFFGGGAGAGVTVTPIAFIVISGGTVKINQIEPFTGSVDRALEKVPEVVELIKSLILKATDKDKGEAAKSEQAIEPVNT